MNGRGQFVSRWVSRVPLILALFVFPATRDAVAVPQLAEIKAAAEAGNAQAQDTLAEAYRHQADKANARIWYRKAAAQGVANSQYQLAQALIYEATSSWLKVDSKPARAAEGVELLNRAAQQDHKRAQLYLGRLHQEGKVIPQDFVEAYQWFAIAGRGGPLDPSSVEGRIYRDRLILKMSQEQIAEGERRASRFIPGTPRISAAPPPPYAKGLKLQGISAQPGRELAIINGQTLEAGETARVKVGGHSVDVKCLQVTTNSARIQLRGSNTTLVLELKE